MDGIAISNGITWTVGVSRGAIRLGESAAAEAPNISYCATSITTIIIIIITISFITVVVRLGCSDTLIYGVTRD